MNNFKLIANVWALNLLTVSLVLVLASLVIAQDATTTKDKTSLQRLREGVAGSPACNDKVDNDKDGLIDLADFDCRRVIIIDIDGLRWDSFNSALRGGNLPSFQKMLGGDEGCKADAVFFDRATTVFPSVTLVGHASIFTGVYPGGHGITGNQWFDRVGDAFKPSFIHSDPFDYMHPCSQFCINAVRPPLMGEIREVAFLRCRSLTSNKDALLSCSDPPSGLTNKHLKSQTIYEAAGEAGKSSVVVFSQYWKGVPEDEAVHPNQDELYVYGLTETRFQSNPKIFGEFDRGMILHVMDKLLSDGFPDILTVYFSGLDATGHMRGIESQTGYLSEFIDPNVSLLLLELKKRDGNWCKDTLFVITADHGQMPVDTKDEASLGVVKSALDNIGFKNNYVVAVNGGMAHVYLKNRSTLNWPDPPRFDEDVIPAAEALCGKMDKNKLWKILVRVSDGDYKVYNGRRGEGTNKKSCETVGTVELTEDQDLKSGEGLNAIDLIKGLNSDRSGDVLILLTPSSYFEHGDLIRWGKKADHGSLHEGGLRVPIVLGGGGVKLDPEKCERVSEGNHCNDVVRTVNVARTIARYLGFEDELKEAKDALPVRFSE